MDNVNTIKEWKTSSSAIDRTFLGEFKSIKSPPCRNGTFKGEAAKFVPFLKCNQIIQNNLGQTSLNGFKFVWMANGNAGLLGGWNEVDGPKKWPILLLFENDDGTGVGGGGNVAKKHILFRKFGNIQFLSNSPKKCLFIQLIQSPHFFPFQFNFPR